MTAAKQRRTVLEQLIRARGRSYEKTAEDLQKLITHNQIDGSISGKHLERLAKLERPHEECFSGTRQALEAMFERPFDELFTAPAADGTGSASSPEPDTATSPRELAATAARGSMDFLAWAEDDRLPPSVLEHVQEELQRIAIDYVHAPLLPLFEDLVHLRDTTRDLLKDRPHPGQSRELFAVGGITCLMLAHASQNLGNSQAAGVQANTAWACAEQADHNDLRAWVLGTQALIAEWSPGRLRKAVEFAQRGQQYAVSSESRVRLAAIEARVHARSGNSAEAVEAVIKAQRARDTSTPVDSLAEYGGLLTFPEVKQLYYAGSTLCMAGEPEAAEQTALQAIQTYESGPTEQRSYGDEALARVDVAVARLATGDLEGAEQALSPVLALPPAQRIQQISSGLDRVRTVLGTDRFAMVGQAGQLRDHIDAFAPSPHDRPLS